MIFGISDALLYTVADNRPWNKYDIAIGGWDGVRSQIRYDNAYATDYLKEVYHSWTDYEGMRNNTVLRVLDGNIQFIFDGSSSYGSMEPGDVFIQYNDAEIEKENLRFLRVSSWSSTPIEYGGLKWTFKSKIISTGKIQTY